jgi:hypothetical protein
MGYTNRPFNYTGELDNQVENDLELANDNFEVLAQAFVNNDPTTGKVKNADTVDEFHASQTPQANTIPVANSDGKLDAGWLPSGFSGGSNLNQVEFTSSGTWTVPSGVTKILIMAVAGGGGGCFGSYESNTYYYGLPGECGHGYIGVINVVPNEVLNITIGSGGRFGSPYAGNGGNTIIQGSASGLILNLQGGRGGRGIISTGGDWTLIMYGYPSIFGRYNLGYGSGGDGGYIPYGENGGKSGAVRIIYFT